MEAQSTEGFILMISIAAACLVIMATAFSLTFFRKKDNSEHKH